MTTTTPDLVALRELLAKATPGPWDSRVEPQRYPECDDADLPATISGHGQHIAYLPERYDADLCQVNDVDARLIVWLRNNGLSLLDAIERLEREREEANARYEEAVNWNDLVDRHGTDQFDDLAERWLAMEPMQRFFQAHCSTFAKWADDQLMQRYRQSMADMIQLAFVEGALVGIRAAEARADAAEKERDQAREALERIRSGDIPRPVGTHWRNDCKPSKHDKCTHGVRIHDDCAGCINDFIRQAIGRG